MTVARNVLIIALLALALTVLPGAGNLATALLTALSIFFFATIGLLAARTWRDTSLTRDVMTDRQRGLLYGSFGALALMIVGLDEMFDSGPGTVAWLVVVAGSVWLIVTTWRQASTY